jgi:hypothetical protein
MKFYKFLKSLFIKPKPINICEYNLNKGKYECHRPNIPNSFTTKEDGL